MKRSIIIAILFLMVGVSLFFWYQSEQRSEQHITHVDLPVIKIGVGNWIGFGPFFLAQEKDYFKATGFDVQPIFLTGTGERNAALTSREIEGLAAPIDTFIFSKNQGVPLKIVLAVDESTGGDGIVATPDIKTIRDLAGKTVAFQKGMPGHFLLLYLLNEFGLSEKDIVAKNLDTAEAGTAFITHQVDAAVVWEPWLSKATEEGKGHVLASTKEHRGIILDCLAIHPDFIKENPSAVTAIIAGWFKAVEYWQANPDDANAIMAKKYNMSAEKYALILTGAAFADRQRNREIFSPSPDGPSHVEKLVGKALEVWSKAGIVSGNLDLLGFIDPSFQEVK